MFSPRLKFSKSRPHWPRKNQAQLRGTLETEKETKAITVGNWNNYGITLPGFSAPFVPRRFRRPGFMFSFDPTTFHCLALSLITRCVIIASNPIVLCS
ncbi:hypothetical protein MOUN0_N11100 [Monosporozyma unispora]